MADRFDFDIADANIFDIDIGEILEEAGVDVKVYVWICALVNTCSDCLPRHGEGRFLNEWEAAGMPATGWSVCGEHCQCEVLPEEHAGDVQPLQRQLDATTTGLSVRVPSNLQGGDPQTLENMRASIETRRAFRLIGQQNNPNQRAFEVQRARESSRDRARTQSAQRRR